MIKSAVLAGTIASGLLLPTTPALYVPAKPAIIKVENIEFSKHMLLGMPITMGFLGPHGPGLGIYEVTYRGVFQTNSDPDTSSAIDIGPAYDDRIVLVGYTTPQDPVTALTLGGVDGVSIVNSTYGSGWFTVREVPGESVTLTQTGALYATLYIYTVTGLAGGKDAVISATSGSANNNNSTSCSFASCLIGDRFLAVGCKSGTGATDSWGSFGGTGNVSQTVQNRIGTAGSGWGGTGSSVEATSSGTKTVTGSGSDSSKPITVAAVRLRP